MVVSFDWNELTGYQGSGTRVWAPNPLTPTPRQIPARTAKGRMIGRNVNRGACLTRMFVGARDGGGERVVANP
jgi:hypothetical protein